MSSSPPAEPPTGTGPTGTGPTGPTGPAAQARPPRRRWHPRHWTLRTRLVAAVLGLLALVLLATGVATLALLNGSLMNQVDSQLKAAALSTGHGTDGHDDGPPPGGPSPVAVVRITLGPGTPAGRLNSGDAFALSPAQVAALQALPTDGRAYTVDLGHRGEAYLYGPYRMLAVPAAGGTEVMAIPLHDLQDTVTGMAAFEAGLAGCALIAAGLAGTLIVRRSLRPLRRVAATAGRVSQLRLDRGEVALSERVPAADADPSTEVGLVGAAINRMLGHVGDALRARQASETRVRQFVADASHELRTPLAAIRGYAELSRRFRGEVPPDVVHAMRRVESEAARMSSLVDDLLLLARLDSGRPLERAPVDLSRLVVDAVSDAHVAGPEHRFRLDLPEESITVDGDPQRLHQVLANLLGNARTHTPAGTTVVTELSTVDGKAQLVVRDDGPGIPPALLPEVFERFSRADTSRSRAAGSTGLGLSIVAAVVEAHHGTVHVDSAPGRTEFTVLLPA